MHVIRQKPYPYVFFSWTQGGATKIRDVKEEQQGPAHDRTENIDLNGERGSAKEFFSFHCGRQDRYSVIFMQVMVIHLEFWFKWATRTQVSHPYLSMTESDYSFIVFLISPKTNHKHQRTPLHSLSLIYQSLKIQNNKPDTPYGSFQDIEQK